MKRKDALLLCDKWLPLWTGNHPERLIEVYAEDCFYRDPAKPEGIRGKSGLLQYLRKLLAAFPDWTWEAEDVFPVTGGFALRWKATIPVAGKVIVEREWTSFLWKKARSFGTKSTSIGRRSLRPFGAEERG